MAAAVIRPYEPEDRDDLCDVCLRTADAGGDATGVYERDPDLPARLFALPYVYLEPDFAFVLHDGERVSGYVLGVPDTAKFVHQLRERWVPLVGPLHPAPEGEPADRAGRLAQLLHEPERMLLPELADYPAHLHINLLPHVRRAGWGRKLLHTLFDALRQAGVPRVYLGTAEANTAAAKFYERMGFHEIAVSDPGELVYLGRSTEP